MPYLGRSKSPEKRPVRYVSPREQAARDARMFREQLTRIPRIGQLAQRLLFARTDVLLSKSHTAVRNGRNWREADSPALNGKELRKNGLFTELAGRRRYGAIGRNSPADKFA